MSPRRARLLVATVWILSFVICFPPLVGWKDKRVTITNFDSSLSAILYHFFALVHAVSSRVQHDVCSKRTVQHHHYPRPRETVSLDLRADQRCRLRRLQVSYRKFCESFNPPELLLFFLFFVSSRGLIFQRGLKSSSLESENEELGKERVFVNWWKF